MKAAAGGHELLHLWSVDQRGEARTFAAHDGLGNRELLWHGTNGEVARGTVATLAGALVGAVNPPSPGALRGWPRLKE